MLNQVMKQVMRASMYYVVCDEVLTGASFDKGQWLERHWERHHYGTKPGHFETSIIHFPTTEGVSEVSERANGRASGPVLTSLFLSVPDHRAS